MHTSWKQILWQQSSGACDMLENAILACPDEVWNDKSRHWEYWYTTYHTLFWLDFYMSENPDEFAPPDPFTMSEMESAMMPPREYTKEEMLTYLEYGRNKCRKRIDFLPEDILSQRFKFGRMDYSTAELVMYTMRHIQHHTAQLNQVLRQTIGSAPFWVGRGK